MSNNQSDILERISNLLMTLNNRDQAQLIIYLFDKPEHKHIRLQIDRRKQRDRRIGIERRVIEERRISL